MLVCIESWHVQVTCSNVSSSNNREIWGLYSTWTDMRNVYKILVGILGRGFFRNLDLDVRIILKWFVKRWVVMLWTVFTWLKTRSNGRLLWRRYLGAVQKAKNFLISWARETLLHVHVSHGTVTCPLCLVSCSYLEILGFRSHYISRW
jgi:hypothetical protein